MASKILLFLSTSQFQGYLWKDGALLLQQSFADNQSGREQFAAFLRANRMPTYLLTDLIEEDFRHETVIHLHGHERSAQIQRKFEQFYRSTPFRQASLHQRQQEGRRDDEMLFSALTNPSLIQTWLDIMLQQHTPLAGIYSVPGISKPLLRNLQADHILLLTWEKSAGLRQTYFNTKRLYLSRLTPVADDQTFSAVVTSEVLRTQQYLKSLSLLPLGQTLQVLIVCHAKDRRDLQATLHDVNDMSYTYLDISDLGASIKAAAHYADSDATHLLLQLLAARPPDSHYAAVEHTHFFWLWQLNRRLFGLGVLSAIAGLFWSSTSLWESNWLTQDSAALQMQARHLAQRTQAVTRGFSNRLASASDMKSAVTALRRLDSAAPPPEQVWDGIGAVLADFPRISLDRLSWQNGSGNPNTAGTGAATMDKPGIELSGRLDGWSGNYRGSLAYLERFQQALRQRQFMVSASNLPLDVSSRASIADNVLGGSGQPGAFSLRLTRERTP
jgi:hypothetical protein